MALFQNSVERAATELQKLIGARTALESRMLQASQEVGELRSSASGEVALDEFRASGTVGGSGQRRARIAALEGELEDLQSARQALLGRIRTGVLALAAAEAEAKRSQARKLQKELDAHVLTRDGLRQKLEEFEGAQYDRADVLMRKFFPGPFDPAMILGSIPPAAFSKSDAMTSEIRRLDVEAIRLEEQAAREVEGGQISGSSVDELLAAVKNHPLAPSEFEIRRWADRVIARANAEWARKEGTWMPAVDRVGPRFTMVWRDSVIDEARSTATNSHRSRPIPIAASPGAHPPREGAENPTHGWYKSA